MYHIKSDRRSLRTAGEIGRGLQQCLREKPLSAITVTDIHRITGISRATFYRLFDTVDDVLEYLCAQSPEEKAALTGESPERLFTQLLELGLENHDLLKALVDNGRYDLIYRYAESHFQMLGELKPELLRDMDGAAYEYMVSAMAMTMVSTLITWLRRGRRDTPEEIARYTGLYLANMTALVNRSGTEKEPVTHDIDKKQSVPVTKI